MSTSSLIRLDWQAQSAAMTEAAAALKSHALESAALIGRVDNAKTQDKAVAAQKEIGELLTVAEKARKAAKEPALEFGRRIDDAAKAFVSDLKEEQLRIATLVGDFQALEQAKARAAEQARIEEQRKIEQERRNAELKAIREAEIEKARLDAEQRELARQAAASKNKREAELLELQRAEVERQRALAEAKSHEDLDRINAQASEAAKAAAERPQYEPVRAQGQRVVEDWEVTVTDMWLLAKSHPTCVKITELKGEIKSLLNAGVKVAGVRAEKITKAGVTKGRQLAVIEV
jgi:hypothetical protein